MVYENPRVSSTAEKRRKETKKLEGKPTEKKVNKNLVAMR